MLCEIKIGGYVIMAVFLSSNYMFSKEKEKDGGVVAILIQAFCKLQISSDRR